jgi:XTP/dITP diphosphohydrolase
VDALDGAPGIYSARFAGEPSNDKNNNLLLLEKLSGEKNRRARFHCALVYMEHAADPTPVVCQASWYGEILKEEKGQGGFGYDPLFFIESEGCTSAELSPERKSALSHRGQAMQLLLGEMENRFSR